MIGLDKVIHTPHIGDNTTEARQDLSIQIVKQVIDALDDRDYRNVVNMPLMPGLSFSDARPYMQLSESIGSLQHILARSPIRRIAIEIIGEDMNGLIKPMTVGILKGLLTPIHGEKVSYVNAPILATEHGWRITQAKGIKISEYSNVNHVPDHLGGQRRDQRRRDPARSAETLYLANQQLSYPLRAARTFAHYGQLR